MDNTQITEAGDALIVTGATNEQRIRFKNALKDPITEYPQTLSRRQVAQIFGIHADSVKRWEKEGKLRPIKITQRCLRYNRSEVEALLA